jgi:hypothetical protein
VRVCDQQCTKIEMQNLKKTYFGDEVETLCNKEKNHSGRPNPRNSLTKEIASYKVRTHILLMQ